MKLRSYLGVLVLAGLIPLVVLTVIVTISLARQQRAAVERGLSDTVTALAIAVGNDLGTSIKSLETLATSKRLDHDDLPAFYEQATRVRRLHRWSTIGLIDGAGNHRLNIARPLGAALPDLRDREYFKQVMATGRPYVSDLLAGRATATVDIGVAVPVVRDDRIKYVLFAGVDPATFDAVFEAQKLPPQAITSIVSRDAVFIARSPDHARFVGRPPPPAYLARIRAAPEGRFHGPDLGGVERDIAYRRIALTGWTVGFALPAEALNAPVRRVAQAGALVGAGIVVVALGLAAIFARRMGKGIAALASSASALGRGEALESSERLPVAELDEMRRFLAAADEVLQSRERERDALLKAEHEARVEAETAARNLHDSETRLRRLVASPLIGIAFATLDGIVDANDAFLDIVGHTRDDLEARRIDWRAFIRPEVGPAGNADLREPVGAGASGPAETEYVRRDGTRVPILVGATVLERSPLTWVCFVLDISPQKTAERERAELLTREQAARAEAEAANSAKDQFLAMLGHELRNPLGAIAGAVTILNAVGRSEETAERARAVIGRQVQHLSRLVDDLLDVSRVTSGKVMLDRHPIDLGDLVMNVMSTHRASGRLDRHQVAVEVAPVWVDADETRIEQVVTNLLGNALKYTPAGGSVTVRLQAAGETAVLEVADTGVGIPPHLLDRVFDLFVQGAGALDRGQGGLGLGLTLVRALVGMHGGTVQASSPGPGQGAVLTVRLPRVGAPAKARAPTLPPAPAPRRRVLIIEDNDDARDMLRVLLTLGGHEVHHTADAATGVGMAAAIAPDVALVDIGLPELDGYEVARRIRALECGKSMLLIAVTGYGQEEDRRRALDAGFDAHLTKPVSPERLAELVAGAGGRTGAPDAGDGEA